MLCLSPAPSVFLRVVKRLHEGGRKQRETSRGGVYLTTHLLPYQANLDQGLASDYQKEPPIGSGRAVSRFQEATSVSRTTAKHMSKANVEQFLES